MKFILGMLSFFTNKAAKWARCYIENATDNKAMFQDPVMMLPFQIKFWRQFRQCFELVNADASALIRIQAIKQGNKRFVEFISEFETLSVQTSLSTVNLAQKFKERMSKEYLTYMSFFMDANSNMPSIYDQIYNTAFKVNKLLNELDNNFT